MNQAVTAFPAIGNLAAAALNFVRTVGASHSASAGRRVAAKQYVVEMKKNQTLWFTNAMAREFRCESGTLWLTLDGQPQDIVLESGQSYRCESPARLSVHALAQASMSVVG